MNPILRVCQLIYSVYAILLFVLLMLIIFPFVLLASLFGKIRGGNMIYRICIFWSDAWFFLIGVRIRRIYTASPPVRSMQYIFVANHISYVDVPMILESVRHPLRALGKSELAKVPVFGFLYRYGAILVDRSNAENRSKSVVQLKSVLKKKISVFIFPEGTFNTTGEPLKQFFDGAFRIAIETQTPIFPIIFPDTVRRLHYNSIFSFSPGRCRAVYLEPVPVAGLQPEDLPQLKERVYRQMEIALVKIRSEDN